ncbi:MAG: Pirin-like protein [Methyloprofundus sp.]|nr:Pirin-like protein [Methyloprofundus sp.]
MKNDMRVIHVSDLPLGGFAGIVEKQMVISPKLKKSASSRSDISLGLGSFIYLATGHFKPNDGAPLHSHDNVDIVTVVLSGSVKHAGTLGDGSVVSAQQVQVQRAGEGMMHSEVNPNNDHTDFVQIWFLPPEQNLTPDYQNIILQENELITVLGGGDPLRFANKMTCKVGSLAMSEQLDCEQAYVVLITDGTAIANGTEVTKGDLLEGEGLHLEAMSKLGLVLIY